MNPEKTYRDGVLSVSIWRNSATDGDYFSCQIQKVYEDDKGKLQNTQSLNARDMLRIARLAQHAYDYVVNAKTEPAV
ncbi:MAG: hypothetical protein EX270_01640 [Pseudomonadales bacterium]|nr:MAG: hypothetical protein EX270_01640 [Pseudomonadales bacterium]